MPDTLTRRALNRALLGRQLLLRRDPLPGAAGPRAGRVIETVEHLVGLQAQAPFPPYYGLWSRLDGFRPGDLSDLIVERRVVRIGLMRGTIHLVSADDCLRLRPPLQQALERGLRANFGRQLTDVDRAELARAGRALVEDRPMTLHEIGDALKSRWPQYPPSALAQGVRALVPLVQVPPRAVWGRAGQAAHTSAEAWLGRPLAASASPDQAVLRYLAAFGPATVADAQAWSGLTGLREVVARLEPQLRTFRDAQGRELFDLPGAPRPDPDTPAPVRLVAEFDNLVLSHGDRSRVISEPDRQRLYTKNGIFPGTVLIDGFVRGMWRVTTTRRAATATVELFGDVGRRDRDAVTAEGERLLEFAAPDTPDAEIRFGPIT
ncbi:MAG TPA: winged helix DNA-binding domain-containing protein [Streptosporangiaceae bacterium]|nr:winged helix DNA-binding domain-containing protein [Streptosporangiaceae bacterium]